MTDTEYDVMEVACDNCGWEGTGGDLLCTLHQIHHLADRLDVGGVVPAGECPECGTLAYRKVKT